MEVEKIVVLGWFVVGVVYEVNILVGICIIVVSYFEDENKRMGKVLVDKWVSKGLFEKYVYIFEEISLLFYLNLDCLVELIISFK